MSYLVLLRKGDLWDPLTRPLGPPNTFQTQETLATFLLPSPAVQNHA